MTEFESKMAPWDLTQTRTLIDELYGKAQLDIARESLNSVVDRQRYAQYHYGEIKSLLKAHLDSELAQNKSVLHVILGGDAERQNELDWCLVKVGANVIACLQSMHSLADILAHAVYYSLGCNRSPGGLSERAVALQSVQRHISGTPDCATVSLLLSSISGEGEFKYLGALVNHSKHRSVIKAGLWADMTQPAPEPYTLKFQPFTYNGTTYERREIWPFLEKEYDRLSMIVVATGHALNDVLLSRQSP